MYGGAFDQKITATRVNEIYLQKGDGVQIVRKVPKITCDLALSSCVVCVLASRARSVFVHNARLFLLDFDRRLC